MPFEQYRSVQSLPFPIPVAERLDAVLTEVAERSVLADAERSPDRDLVRRLAAAGLSTARLPRHLGGSGLDLVEFVHLMVVVARADPSVAQVFRSHISTTERALQAHREGRDARWLDDVRAGLLFGNATTETAGAAGRPATTLRRAEDGTLRLTGDKAYATGSWFADRVHVLAVDEDGEHVVATVPTDAPGVEIVDDWDGFGQRTTVSGTARFRGVVVAPDAVRYGEGDGTGRVDALLQLAHLATIAGVAVRIHDDGVDAVRGRRRHFSHAAAATPSDDPVVQLRIGELSAAAATALALVESAATALSRATDDPDPALAAAAHVAVTQAQVALPPIVLRAADTVFEVGGASMTSAAKGLDRHWRNVRTLASHNPGSQKARLLGVLSLTEEPLPDTWYVGERASS